MPKTNIIKNGSFDQGNSSWSGSDLETNYTEDAYLGNKSRNRVAEMDGRSKATTVMQQTITVAHPQTTAVTFRTALRNASRADAGEGFLVQVVDNKGRVITEQAYRPTSHTWQDQSMLVRFPAAGNYTLRFRELGKDDSLGAIVDDISMLVCFVAGTLIDTAQGLVAVQDLRVGDAVWTLDAGYQPLRWIGTRRISGAQMQADPRLCPVVFAAGSLGDGLPKRAMAVSPQHRICVTGWRAEMHFGSHEVLVPAISLVNDQTIRQAGPREVTYVHFLLDAHQIVRSDGVLTESFFPTSLSLRGVDAAARAELLALFPDLGSVRGVFSKTVRPVLQACEGRILGRAG